MLLSVDNISLERLVSPSFSEKEISLSVARLDKIHTEVSGNKIFKLHYFTEECLRSAHKTLLTFGGAFSNHLVATAFLCRQYGLKSIGIVRGEQPDVLSETLLRCMDSGMHLKYISREAYKCTAEESFLLELKNEFGEFTLVPEGGYHFKGAKGASLIQKYIECENATHVCTAVGTATTLAGLLMSKKSRQKIIAVPVIKNMTEIPRRIFYLTGEKYLYRGLEIFDNYHFGGYAKFNDELINFMNAFYHEYQLPTDFVYTAKLMHAVTDMIKKNYFPKGSRIVCLHTGGLQGNTSLQHRLNF